MKNYKTPKKVVLEGREAEEKEFCEREALFAGENQGSDFATHSNLLALYYCCFSFFLFRFFLLSLSLTIIKGTNLGKV